MITNNIVSYGVSEESRKHTADATEILPPYSRLNEI